MKFLLIILWLIIAQYTYAQDKQIGYLMSIRDTSGFNVVKTVDFDSINTVVSNHFTIDNLQQILDTEYSIEISNSAAHIYVEKCYLIKGKKRIKAKTIRNDNKARLD